MNSVCNRHKISCVAPGVSDQEMAALDITRDPFHGEWNYTIRPRKSGNDAVIL